jgi:molybdopterin/thiamine biosynthesis adenylyltransferase
MKKYSIAMTEKLSSDLFHHLKRKDRQEDLCFALWNPSSGEMRYSAILNEVILPIEGDRQVHGNVSFNAQYLDRVLRLALEKKMGIAFLHNHFTPGWQGMSQQDIKTEKYLSAIVFATTRLPLTGLTMGSDGAWSGRFWTKLNGDKYKCEWVESVRVIGNKFVITFNDQLLKRPKITENMLRTVSAWGPETQSTISRLKIGIIGAGSVGSIVGESLKKIGIRFIKLIDFDTLERKNLDRTLHAREKDIGKSKAIVLVRELKKTFLFKDFQCEAIDFSIVEEAAFKKALDCDILFSCVDRPWPRYILDKLAYAHLIPVIDGGIRLETNRENSKLIGADWKTNTVGPERPCLECIGQYTPEDVTLEQLGMLDDPKYVEGLSKDHFIHRNENVFAFSLGLGFLEMQQLLSLVIAPFGLGNIGGRIYHFITGDLEKERIVACKENCRKKQYLAKGDSATIGISTIHIKAQKTRALREKI